MKLPPHKRGGSACMQSLLTFLMYWMFLPSEQDCERQSSIEICGQGSDLANFRVQQVISQTPYFRTPHNSHLKQHAWNFGENIHRKLRQFKPCIGYESCSLAGAIGQGLARSRSSSLGTNIGQSWFQAILAVLEEGHGAHQGIERT